MPFPRLREYLRQLPSEMGRSGAVGAVVLFTAARVSEVGLLGGLLLAVTGLLFGFAVGFPIWLRKSARASASVPLEAHPVEPQSNVHLADPDDQ